MKWKKGQRYRPKRYSETKRKNGSETKKKDGKGYQLEKLNCQVSKLMVWRIKK